MVQRLLPPTPEEDEEQAVPGPGPAPSPAAVLPKPDEILKGILDPLDISNERKTDIWNAVFQPHYKFDHLQRILDSKDVDLVPGAVKTDIWNVKSGRMFPEYPLPTGAAPRPGQIFGEPGLEEPVGPQGQIRQELPGLMPAEIKMVTDPETGEEIRTRVPTAKRRAVGFGSEPGVRGAELVAPGPDIPPAFPALTGVPLEKTTAPRVPSALPPTPKTTPLETPKIGPDPTRELVTPVLPSGRSELITMGGRKGYVNFDVEPEIGGTPSPRYAFDTVEGGRWFYQLEKDYQGGRWENADHAEADFEGYKGLPSGARKTQLTRMWQGDAGIVKAIDDAAAAGKSFAELKGDLAPFNTHRQISIDETKTFGFPEMSGELMLGKMEEQYPLPIVKEMIPYRPKVDEDLLNRATYGELMDAKLQGPFVRWESHPNAQIMYESLLKLPEEDRSKFIANRWWQQPEVNAAINFAVQYKVPWEDLTDFLAEYDTTPPRQLGPLRADAPMPPLPNREPSLNFVPWQFEPTVRAVLKEYKDLWPEKTEEQLMEEFEYDIGKRSREKNLWEFFSDELFTPGGIYERTPYEAKSLVEFAELTAAFYAVEAGKATDREEQLLIDYYSMVEEANLRGSTIPYDIARTASFMPAFMVEIYTSGGVYTTGKRAALKTAKNLLLRAMPRMGKKLAQRQAKRRAAREGIKVGFGRRAASFAEDAAGRGLVLFPTRGTVTGFQRILHGEDKDLLAAMWHGYLDTTIEVFSELAGGPTALGLSKVWKKLPIQSKIENLKNAIVYRWMGKTGKGFGEAMNLLQASGYHGMFMEMGEERLGEVLRAGTQLKPYELPNIRQLIVEAGAFSLPGMGAMAMGIAERNNRDEGQKLAEDIEFFGQLATQGLTVQQVYDRAPKRIKDAIDTALAQGETLEDLIDADQDVQTPVHGIRDIPKDSVILLPGVPQPKGGEEERRWNAYWKTQVDVDALPMSDEDKAALRTEGTKRDAESVNTGFKAAIEIINAYETDSPEQDYTTAYTNWRMGEDVSFPARGADQAVAWFGVDEEQVRVIQEDIDRIAQELDIAPWRAPRSEEQAAADPLPPHIQDLVDSLPEDQRAEAAINPGYFSEVTTGEQFAATAYRGEGATLEEIYGPGSVERGIAVDLAGPAQYYSFHPEHAQRYGDKVTEVEVDLNNPLVIDNDQQWFEILAAAGAAHLSPTTFVSQAEPTGRAAATQKLQAWIREQGHDGIIVKVPEMSDESLEGLPAARLRDSWEHSQVVVFDVEAVEPGKPPREEEAPRRPETGNEGLLKIEGLKYIETLTTDEERDYATKFLNFKLGLEPDPGQTLPIHIVGMIRLEIEAIATRVGLKPPTEIPPTEIPTTPEQAAPGPEVTPEEAAPGPEAEDLITELRNYSNIAIEGGGIESVELVGSYAQRIPSLRTEGAKLPGEESDVDLLFHLDLNLPAGAQENVIGEESEAEKRVREIVEANPNIDVVKYDSFVSVGTEDGGFRYFVLNPKGGQFEWTMERGVYAVEATAWGEEQAEKPHLELARKVLKEVTGPPDELPAGPLSEFLDTLDAGTTFTLTEADIPEISQLPGAGQVALDREKFLGTWTRGEAMRGDVVQLRWINSETGIALASRDFEPLGSTRLTAAIGRSQVEERRREAGPQFSVASVEIDGKFEAWVMSEGKKVFTTESVDTAEEAERLAQDWISDMVDTGLAQRGKKPTELPPTPEERPAGPAPSRTLRIGRGANGQVVVVFKHKDDADLFSAVGRMRRKAQGKEGPQGPSWERLRELYPAGAVNIGSFSQDYRDQIMEAIKGLPEGDTFQAPRPTHFTVTPQEELPPTPEEAPTDEAFDAQMNRYPDGTKFTITDDDVLGASRVTGEGSAFVDAENQQKFVGEWVKVPDGWEKTAGTPLPFLTDEPDIQSAEFVAALGEEGMSSVLKRNGLMGLLTGDFIYDEVEATPTDEAGTPEEATSPHMTIALKVAELIEEGHSIDNPTLTQIANEAFGGTRGEGAYDPRDAYDAAEVGLNMVIRRNTIGNVEGVPTEVTLGPSGVGSGVGRLVNFEAPGETTPQLRGLMAQMPRQSDRTDEAVEMQQFSTPPELAFIAAYLSGGWRSGTRVGLGTVRMTGIEALEPSAGTGSIATMLELGGMKVTANEIAPRRAQLLREQGFTTTEYDAEFLHSVIPSDVDIHPDIIVMNPPFSATGGRTASHATKYGAKHLKEALARLNEGGRLVAIVGQGMAYNRPGFSDWWDRVGDQYNIRANVGISGKHYGKWGTNFGQQLLVIDKTGPTPGKTVAERIESIIIGEDLSPQEALRLLEPLAQEDISGRLAERPTEEGVRGPAGAIPPGPGAGVQPPPDTPGVRPERGPERVDKPTPGVRGPAEREELGGVEPGAGAVPGPGPGGTEPGYGEGERGGPGEPGGTPGVGSLPGSGDLGRAGPSPGIDEGPEFGAKNTVFKKDEAEEALERLRKRIKSQLDVGLDPDMMKDMFKVGGYLFESGVRKFADWAKKMLELLGDTVRPVLQSVFDTVKGFYETSSQETGAQYTKENRQSVVDEVDPFSKYTVRKATYEGSQEHPANIVESSILASVEPPDSTYVPNLPSEVITEGRLSDLQMEAVTYIGQRHETVFVDGTRAGFWLGDGTGLGKGREIVGTIWDNWNKGRRRAVWISVNHVLGSDAERDVTDMGAPMKVIRQKANKYKSGKPIDDMDGIFFSAYSMVSYRINGAKDRFNQMVDWMGPDFDGVIAFDESHLLKNALKGDRSGEGVDQEGGTQSGRMAAMLEEMYPKARFVYVSATGATVPRNMGYMTRLGLWGAGRPFPEFLNFLQAMQRGGLGAMEMLSRDLKAIGAYMSRIISYEGVGYETIEHALTPMEIDSYNKAADIWQDLITEFEAAIKTANQPRKGQPGVWSAFYGGEQRFFLQYMMSLKLPDLFAEVGKDIKLGRTVVINLFNTNEDMTDRMVKAAKAQGLSIDELDFTPKQMIIDLIEKYFPLVEYVDSVDPKTGAPIKVIKYQTEVDPITGKVRTTDKPVLNRENLEKQAEMLEKLADVNFPDNPMDAIVEHFGVENISEVSGRTKRLIRGEHVVRKVKGVRRDELNEYETSTLQDGTNRIAVITGSAATGISMHSDLSKKNQQQRVFYAFQLNWSADKQLQSFGRVHRSNQDSAPIYKLLRTNLKSEERIVNATSRRLAGLGALTTGSREALAGGLFEIEDLTDVYGEAALVVTYQDIFNDRIPGIEGGPELVGIMGMLDGNGNVDRQHSMNVNRFLNRIMALHVDVQNGVFNRFYDHYMRIVQLAKDEGSFDLGIQPIRDRNFNKPIAVDLKQKPNNPETVHVDKDSGAETQLIDLVATYPVQKLTFENAQKMGGTANRGFIVNVRSKKIYTVYPTDKTKYSAEAVRKGFPGTQPLYALTNPKGLTHQVPEFQLTEGQNFQDTLQFQRTQAAAAAMRRRKERQSARTQREKDRAKPIVPGDNVIYQGSQFTVLEWLVEDGVDMVSLESREGAAPYKRLNVPAHEVTRRETRDRPPFQKGERVIYKGQEYHVLDLENAAGFIGLEAINVYPTFENVPVEMVDRPGEASIPETPEPEPPTPAILSDQQMWEAELALLGDTDQATVTMLVGAVIPIYDKVIGSGEGALRRLRVVRTVLDDGTAYVGMHIQANEVGALKERLGIGTPLGSATAQEIYEMVQAGAVIELDNGWRLRMTKVHREDNMELDARGKYHKEELISYGLIMEILQAKRRFFVPLDATEGPKAIAAIMELHKPVRNITTQSGAGDPGVAGDPGPGGAGDIMNAGDLALPGDTVAGTADELTDFDQGEYNRVTSEAQGIPATPDERRAKEIPPSPGQQPTAEFTAAEARAAKLPGNVPTNVLAEKMGLSYRDARKYVTPIESPVIIDAFPDDIPADMWPDAEDPIHAGGSEREMTMSREPKPGWFEDGLHVSYPDVYEAYEQILVALGKNVPIRIGRFKNKARGIFKIFTEVIRLNKANNIPTAAHEIGHAIEKAVYGWSREGGPSPFTFLSPGVRAEMVEMGKALYGKRRPNAGYDREGWAEFMRYYLTGDLAEEKAPRTYRWFEDTFLKDNPDIQDSLNKAKELTTKYRLQGTKMRLKGGIKWGQDKSNRFLNMMKEMSYKTWVEMLSPLEHMSAVAERLLGEPLREEEDPYLTARSRRLTAGGKVNTMVHRSMIDIAGNKVGPPLNDMEALVMGQRDEFAWYLWGRRAQERWRDHNKDPGMSLAEADWIVEELETPEFLLAAQMFYDWNVSLMNYARQGGLLNKKAYDAILEGSHDYMPLYRVFDEVDPEFTKEFSGRGRMGGGNAFPFMKGKRGGRIRDPFTVAVERARRIVLQTDQRIVLMQIMRMGADPWLVDGMGIEIEEVARPNVPIPISIEQTLRELLKTAINAEQRKLVNQLLSGGVKGAIEGAESMDQLVIKLKKEFAELGILSELLTFFVPAQRPKGSEVDPIVPITDKDGKIRWFQVPNELYKLLEGLDVYRLGSTLDLILGSPTRAMRMTTTALRPVFALWRNPIKDLQTFIMHTQSDKKPHMLVAEWVTTMADIVRNGEDSPYFAQFLRFGLEAGTQLGQDIKQTKRATEGLFKGKWKRKMQSPLDAYRDLMSIPEMGTRVTELRLMAEKVGWKPGEQMTFNQSIQLMNASKLASVDFTAAGSMGRKFNQAIPFFNANIQGNRQFYENMRDRPRRTILRGLTVFTIPTLMLWWVNKDEEWYRDMPWWERFTYWNLGKLSIPLPIGEGRWEFDIGFDPEYELPYIYQIPRAFEWGAAFSALPEALFDAVYENDPIGMKKVFGHIFDVAVPQNLPPTAEIPLEIAVNMDSWTGNRIIPQAETRYPASEQKGKYTSRLSTYIARILPEITYQLGLTEQPEIPGRIGEKLGSPRVWDHAIRGFFGGVGPELLDTAGLGTRPFGGNLRDALMGPNDDSLPVASWLFWMTRRGGKKAGRSQTVDDFYEEWARVNRNYENGKVKAYALGEKSVDEQQRFSARYQWPETPERRRYRLQLNDAEKAMQALNLLERNITNYKELEVTRQIQVGVAREALDHPKVPMTAGEIEVYEAEIAAMPLAEKTRIMTAAYIRANTVGNDPESIWGTAAALGIPRDEVARLIDNTTVSITLLQVNKHHPDATAEQVEEIEQRIRDLKERRLIERYQATPIRARFPAPPGQLPPTP